MAETVRKKPNPARRNEQVHDAILDAAAALLNETEYANVTIDAIAIRAGAGRQTIYRWWSSKAAIFMEVYNRVAQEVLGELGGIDTGSLRRDLQQLLQGLFRLLTTTIAGKAVRGMIAEAQSSPAASQILIHDFMQERWRFTQTIYDNAITRGEIDPKFDVNTFIDLTGGVLIIRLLIEHAPLSDSFVEQVVEVAVSGMAKRDGKPK
jgi:AcrR family transcriptional regulator